MAALCAWTLTLGAGSAPASGWQLQGHIEPKGESEGLLGISCPSQSLCVAVGEGDEIASSTNPDGGAGAWHEVHPQTEDEKMPPPPPPGFTPPPPLQTSQGFRKIRGVSCPSPGLCVAVTFDGYVFSSTNPAGGAGDWHITDIDGKGRDTHLLGVSCPSVNLCVAVSGDRYTAGKVLSTTNPTGGTAAWKVVQLDESLDLRGISCGTTDFCVAVAEEGRLLYSTNPTGGPQAWTEVGKPGGPGNLHGVSCVALAFCVAGNSGGNLIVSTTPDGPASSWEEVDGGASVQITDVECLPSRQCVAVDDNGNVLTTGDATARRNWARENLIGYQDPAEEFGQPLNALFGASCPSSSFCALAGADGRIFTGNAPFSGPPEGSGGGKKKARRPRRPRVTISLLRASHRVRGRRAKSAVTVRFHADGQVRGFLCARDGRGFRPCHPPVRYRAAVGRHRFRVRAIGMTGLKGPVAGKRFSVVVNTNHHQRP